MLKIPENDKVKMVKITNYELQTQKANTTNSKYYKLKYHKNQPCVKKILHRADLWNRPVNTEIWHQTGKNKMKTMTGNRKPRTYHQHQNRHEHRRIVWHSTTPWTYHRHPSRCPQSRDRNFNTVPLSHHGNGSPDLTVFTGFHFAKWRFWPYLRVLALPCTVPSEPPYFSPFYFLKTCT